MENMVNHNEMGLSFENHQPKGVVEAGGDKEELFGIGDLELGILMEDNDQNGPLNNNNRNDCRVHNSKNKNKKERVHRHSKEQIQILKSLYKQCPHPDEKQRKELSQLLNMKKSQIKYWFQNQRSYKKIKTERHDNEQLKEENDRLRIDNAIIQKKITNMVCSKCRGDDNQMSQLLSSLECSMRDLREEKSHMEQEIQHLQTHIDKSGGGFAGLARLQTQSSSGSSLSTNVAAAAAPIGTSFMTGGSSSASSVVSHENALAHALRSTGQVPSMEDIVSGRISAADPWLGGRITRGGYRPKKKSVRDVDVDGGDDE
ncbi:Homeobox-leucine zipper protein ROC3 [Acorus gramineus]|uniref:Homeobox-leucine zipper protein ROC3 n=1 Tax=Acorus gramineus TaxID=55184 RepID=A0AAV9ABQ2_ACOGR|nr:Homeobox-leucine zipper protein ROC3 [Acorus gramineus]